MAEHHELYRRAQYYDIIFNRDVQREVRFVLDLCARHMGRPAEAVLDLACGPAYHARAFARQGLRAVGLDLRAEMVAFAREQAGAEAERISWIVGDMRDFKLDEPVDVAFTMFDSIDCLQTSDEIVAHLGAVAANLRPGGLYLIDLTHPRDCSPYDYGHFFYEGERDGCHVRIDWATNNPVADPLTQVARVAVRMTVHDNGVQYVYDDLAAERFILPQELIALARLSRCFEVRAWHGSHDIDQPFDATPASNRMIAVLQKVEGSTSYALPSLEARRSAERGTGVFAMAPIAAGEVLVVWSGEVLAESAVCRADSRTRHHSLQVDDGFYLGPNQPPELADYVNHSCNPNAGMRGSLTLVAMRDIAVGEEICFDYAMTDTSATAQEPFVCQCGAVSCRGQVTGDDWQRRELQQRYGGFFAPHVQRRIALAAVEQG